MNRIGNKLLWGLMAFLAVGVAVFLIGQYAPGNPDRFFPQQRLVYIAHKTGLMAHIFGAGIALLIGPFQFLPAMRRKKYLGLHRWLGRLYLLGILVGGLSGLYMATFAHGGTVAQMGFAALAVFWLTTGYFAYLRIRARDIQAHKRWMTRNFALTFAAVTLRLWLPILTLAVGLEFIHAYRIVAWLCWIPNFLLAEWIVRRRQHRLITRALAGAAAD